MSIFQKKHVRLWFALVAALIFIIPLYFGIIEPYKPLTSGIPVDTTLYPNPNIWEKTPPTMPYYLEWETFDVAGGFICLFLGFICLVLGAARAFNKLECAHIFWLALFSILFSFQTLLVIDDITRLFRPEPLFYLYRIAFYGYPIALLLHFYCYFRPRIAKWTWPPIFWLVAYSVAAWFMYFVFDLPLDIPAYLYTPLCVVSVVIILAAGSFGARQKSWTWYMRAISAVWAVFVFYLVVATVTSVHNEYKNVILFSAACMMCYQLFVNTWELGFYKAGLHEAKKVEAHLAAENKALEGLNRMRVEFLANISHEIKTPLTVMSGYAQQTRREIENNEVNEETAQNLRVIQKEASRLAELAESMLYTSKNLQTGIAITPTKPMDILERVAAICEPLLAKNGNRLTVEAGSDYPAVAANLDMVLQVLLNLCTNANRHTKNGVVSMTAEHKDAFVAFSAEDNGDGIKPELLRDVFSRGVTGDDKTGLGLAICKDIIQQHGGTIDIESEYGKYTRVIFTLPVAEGE